MESGRLLSRAGYDLFIEIGPQPTLLGMAKATVPDASVDTVVSIPPEKRRDDWAQLLESVAALYVAGVDIDWVGFDREYARQKVELSNVSVPTGTVLDRTTLLPAAIRHWTSVPASTAPANILHSCYTTWCGRISLPPTMKRLALRSPARLAKEILPSIAAASTKNGIRPVRRLPTGTRQIIN